MKITALTLLILTSLLSHGGRTDSNGGHTNRKTGEYHYHNKKTKSTTSYNNTKPKKEYISKSYQTTKPISQNANKSITSFSKSKKILRDKIYNTKDLKIGFYSKCTYESKQIPKTNGRYSNKLVVDKESCNYKPRTKSKRANYIEWEHIVAAHHFGYTLKCWIEGGRKNCKKSNTFKLMEADMYNLVPAIGELNADRSNFKPTILQGEPRLYGDVDFEVDFKKREFEPPLHTRGTIARTYLYFKRTYNLKISDKQLKLYELWNAKYPITDKEYSKQ